MYLIGPGKTVDEARDATRDILMMYHDLVVFSGYLFSGVETGSFDAWHFIRCETQDTDPESGLKLGYELDLELLEQGSSVKILLGLLQLWDDDGMDYCINSDLATTAHAAVESGKLDHLSWAKEFLQSILAKNDEKVKKQRPVFYDTYVRGYFKRIIQEGEKE